MTAEIMIEPVKCRPRAKLIPRFASDIRRQYAAGDATISELASRYQLSYEGVRQVLRERCWKGVI